MIKGDKIKLIKPMGMFDNIGEICDVIDVNENGVISFRFGKNKMNVGCMSYNEFEKYFELVQKTKREWTSWKFTGLFYEKLNGIRISHTIYYRHNGKKVQVKYTCNETVIRTEASCHNEDEFSLNKGLRLAKYRLIMKLLQSEIEDFEKKI